MGFYVLAPRLATYGALAYIPTTCGLLLYGVGGRTYMR